MRKKLMSSLGIKLKWLNLIIIFLILSSDYSWSHIKCTLLSEKDCLASDLCTVTRGSSYCNADVCTDDLVFKGCRKATPEEISVRKNIHKIKMSEKLKCASSKGKWIKNPWNRYGECHCKKKYFFLKDKGCTALRDVCLDVGGIFYPVNTFKCSDEMRKNYPLFCPGDLSYRSDNFKKPKYTHNIRDLCLCKNQHPWHRDKKCL